jgi:hypothetical protein
MLKLDDEFSITITGRVYHVSTREAAGKGIGALMERLLLGQEVPADAFDAWRLTVEDARPREKLKGPRGWLP